MNFVISLFAFIIALGILVTFHELGHFLFARWLGVKVLRFSVGFGKPIFRWQKSGVEYIIAAIPLGGYVKMLDEREGDVAPHELPFAFNRQKLWVRTVIVLAGPIFNFIFAIIAYWAMFMIGITGFAPIIGKVLDNSIAAKYHLEPEMEIIAVEAKKTPNWQEVVSALLSEMGNNEVTLTVKNLDQYYSKEVELNLTDWALTGTKPNVLQTLGIEPYIPPLPPIIGEVFEEEPAFTSGLQANDKILKVNGQNIQYWHEFVEIIKNSPNQVLNIELERAQQKLHLKATPRLMREGGIEMGYLGVVLKFQKIPEHLLRKEHFGFWESCKKSLERTGHYIILTLKLLGKMVTGKIGLQSISGPITIAQGAGATVQVGVQYFLGFLGLISVSLGVINLLPIPILDGGHLLFYVIEAFTRKAPTDRFINIGNQFGIWILIGLMTLAFYNDIARLVVP